MTSNGIFEIQLTPQQDSEHPAGRMLINKAYSGGMTGHGTGQMISKRIDSGPAAYFAIEEFNGTLDSRTGSFTLLHRGYMDSESQSLDITILKDSGSGELAGISGSMQITQHDGGHQYVLEYEL